MSDADHSFVREMESESFYTLGESNHAEIISSDREMRAIKSLVSDYCKKYNA